jgi:hypothetical protein
MSVGADVAGDSDDAILNRAVRWFVGSVWVIAYRFDAWAPRYGRADAAQWPWVRNMVLCSVFGARGTSRAEDPQVFAEREISAIAL